MIRLFASLEIEILMNTEEQHRRLFSDVGICVSVTEVTTTVTVLTSKLVFFCVCVCVCVCQQETYLLLLPATPTCRLIV